MNNIVKIIIFVVAIVACLFAVWFAASFNQDKLDKYNEAQLVNNANPEMIAAFEATTPESLPAFVDQYRGEGMTLAEGLKAQQLQKDILYTYIVELQELNAETFPEYQANFPSHSKALFAKADNAQAYIDGFNAVADFNALDKYINNLENEYNVMKQEFIQQKSYIKAYNSLVNQADAVNQIVSENKKAEDLATLKGEVKQYMSNGKLLNVILTMAYILFFINIALLLIFALKAIITNIRSSYKILVVLALFAVIIILGYVFASSGFHLQQRRTQQLDKDQQPKQMRQERPFHPAFHGPGGSGQGGGYQDVAQNDLEEGIHETVLLFAAVVQIVQQLSQLLDVVFGDLALFHKVSDQRCQRSVGQAVSQGFQLRAGIFIARDQRPEGQNGLAVVAFYKALLLQPLQKPLDGSMLGVIRVGIELFPYLPRCLRAFSP